MCVVEVSGYGVVPKTPVVGGEIVDIAHQNRLAIIGVVNRPRRFAVKSPQGLGGQIRRNRGRNLRLRDLVELLRREPRKCLVSDRPSFAGRGVGGYCRRWIQRGYRLLHNQSPQWLNKRTRRWTDGATAASIRTATSAAFAAIKAPGAGTQSFFCYQVACAGEQAHFEQ